MLLSQCRRENITREQRHNPLLRRERTALTMVAPKTSLLYLGQPEAASTIPAVNSHLVSRRLTHRPSRGRLVVLELDLHPGDERQGEQTQTAANHQNAVQNPTRSNTASYIPRAAQPTTIKPPNGGGRGEQNTRTATRANTKNTHTEKNKSVTQKQPE